MTLECPRFHHRRLPASRFNCSSPLPRGVDLGCPGYPLAPGQADLLIFETSLMDLDRDIDTGRKTGGLEIEDLEHFRLAQGMEEQRIPKPDARCHRRHLVRL